MFLRQHFTGKARQTNSGGQVVTVQPKINGHPITNKRSGYPYNIESDFNLRLVVTKLRKHFDSRGFTTVDFYCKG